MKDYILFSGSNCPRGGGVHVLEGNFLVGGGGNCPTGNSPEVIAQWGIFSSFHYSDNDSQITSISNFMEKLARPT